MANEQHLAILKQGVGVWNAWREKNFEINIDLSYANLASANLVGANLSGANLGGADLGGADLGGANLFCANLLKVNLFESNLSNACLIGADLSSANLNGANLLGANISGANLSNANLSGAKLIAIQALTTNFCQATLTGACIQDWHIHAPTYLQGVKCDYVYLRSNSRGTFTGRRPHDPDKIFARGEFTERFQKVLETVDLFFADGIDWRAFLNSFQELQVQYGEENLRVQGFERKGQSFEVRLAVSSEVDKAEIERSVLQNYETQLQLAEATYRERLHAKEREIEIYKQQSADMLELAKLAASRPITVEAKAEAVADNQFKNTNYNLQGSKFGGGFAAEGGVQIGGQFLDASSQKNMAEAAQEIQDLLDQLSATNPSATTPEQMTIATKAIEVMEKNPALKQRVIAALRAGGTEAFKELVNHPAINILLAVIEGWQNPA